MTNTGVQSAVTRNEQIKEATPTLAGSIAATLADPAADHFSDDDNQFLKFHGSYQQDDRDLRKAGKKYIMMVRGRIPGGVLTAKQWCVFDDLATRYGNDTLRITTRQRPGSRSGRTVAMSVGGVVTIAMSIAGKVSALYGMRRVRA